MSVDLEHGARVGGCTDIAVAVHDAAVPLVAICWQRTDEAHLLTAGLILSTGEAQGGTP